VDCGHRSNESCYKQQVGGKNHCKTTVKMRGFVGESINPDLEMDILVTYTCGNGKEIEAELKDMQVNEKFYLNLFSVTRMLQKRYTLKGMQNQSHWRKAIMHSFLTVRFGLGGEHCTVQDSVEMRTLLRKTATWHL
jgi:hypothetical protein